MSTTDTLRAFDRLLADAVENLGNGQTPGQYVELFTSTYADIPAFTAGELAEFLALALVRLAQIADVGEMDLTPHGRGELIGRTLRGEPAESLPELELYPDECPTCGPGCSCDIARPVVMWQRKTPDVRPAVSL